MAQSNRIIALWVHPLSLRACYFHQSAIPTGRSAILADLHVDGMGQGNG